MIKRIISLGLLCKRLGPITALLYYLASRKKSGVSVLYPPGYEHPVQLRNGTSDFIVYSSVFIYREFHHTLSLRDQAVSVDLGANIGCYAISFAKKYPHGRLIAVEPETNNFQLLARNTAFYPNIISHQMAIWSHDHGVEVKVHPDGNWAFQTVEIKESTAGSKVASLTISQLLERENLEYVDLLKIDIEGAEKELFSGSVDWISKVGAILIELHDGYNPGSSRSFYRAISNYDFTQEVRGEKILIQFAHARRQNS